MTLLTKLFKRASLFFRYSGLLVYWFIFRPDYKGSKVVIECEEEVLLIRHTFQPHYWTFPGGTVEKRETPAQAAIREIKEELDIVLDKVILTGYFSNTQYFKHDTCYCFYATVNDKIFKVDEYEIVEAKWFPADKLPANLGKVNARKIWQSYLDYKTMISSNNA